MSSEGFWLVIGFGGQAFFSARFLVQWIASERARRSVIPIAFWVFSILGGATLFCYALYRQDPVFIAGQGVGLLIYARNLYFIFRERRQLSLMDEDPGPAAAPQRKKKRRPGG